MNIDAQIPAIDRAALTGIVRQAIHSETVEIDDWKAASIHDALAATTAGLYRVAGTGREGDRVVAWSLILKIARPVVDGWSAGTDHTSHPYYWKREAAIYRSGLLDDLPPGGLRAPLCYGSTEEADGSVWLWLEDIADAPGPRWPAQTYEHAARCLGVFNGAYLAGRALPSFDGLSHGWLRAAVDGYATLFATLPSVREHPLVQRAWPGDLMERASALWDQRETYLDALDRLPQTFCHLDAFPRNLLSRRRADGTDETVAIDWAFSGIGPVGQDLHCMVTASVWFFDLEPAQLEVLDAAVFRGYLDGLRAEGWRGDPKVARFGYVMSSALRWGIAPLGVAALNETFRLHFERVLDHPIEDYLDHVAVTQRFFLDRADEVAALAAEL